MAAVVMTASTALGAEWNFYGSARVQTFVEKHNRPGSAGSFTRYEEYLQSNARLGARVTVSDQLTGQFEYGSDADVRILYGEWHFGAGSLLVGQDYSPLNMFYSNQVWWDDTNLFDFGGVYSGRNPMIRLKFGDFQIAALQPSTKSYFGSSTEVTLPKIEAKYRVSTQDGHLQIAGGYNSFDVVDGNIHYDVTSWVVALGGGLIMGPAYINANAWIGQNVGNYGMLNQPFDYGVYISGTMMPAAFFWWPAPESMKWSPLRPGWGIPQQSWITRSLKKMRMSPFTFSPGSPWHPGLPLFLKSV